MPRSQPGKLHPGAAKSAADVDALLAEVERLRALLARVPHLERLMRQVGSIPAYALLSEHRNGPRIDERRAECARLGGACAMDES